MTIKILKPPTSLAPLVWVAVVLLVIAFGFISARSFFIDTLATHLDVGDPAAGTIVDGLVLAGPNDPKTHLLAGVYYEKTFDAADLERSLHEYQKAAELSPSDYTLWLAVAQAAGRLGETDEAENAFKRSLELAPNYASVRWAFGNFLVRQDRGEEGFPLIAQAAADDPQYAGPAVSIVLQMTGGDVAKTRASLGSDPSVNAALTTTLTSLKRYADALAAWSAMPIELRQGTYRQVGTDLMNNLINAKQFRAAVAVAADLATDDQARPAVGQVMNGGFEQGVKLRNSGPFEWQISDGAEPQVGLSETQRHDGGYSLTIVFTTLRQGFREISQQMAVEPGARYRLVAWYKSDLKTEAKFQWQLVDVATSTPLGSTSEMTPAGDWTQVSADLTIPPDSDAVKLMLIRTGCTTAVCPASGTIAFDDISLTRQ